MTGALSSKSRLLLLGVCLVVFCPNLGGARALTSHEMYPAAGARQMVEGGDWLVPMVGDTVWLEKPPLLHWLAALSIAVFGDATEWVVRLPSVVAGIGVVFLVASLAARWMGERAGVVAGIVQCTSWYLMTYARLAEADMLLALAVVAAIVAFVHLQGIGLERPSSRRRAWAIAFWTLIGLSNLSKGPLFGAAIVLIPCLAWLLWRGDRDAWRRVWSPAGLALGVIVAAAWPAAVIIREPEAIHLWLEHTVGRAAGSIGYGQPWWYYATTVPWQLLPWTLATLKGAWPSLRRGWREPDGADRFVWLWGVLPIVALSLSHGKHHHYLIHCLPAFTFVTTAGIFAMGRDMAVRRADAVVVAWGLAVAVAPALLIAAFVAASRLPDHRWDAIALGVLCAVAAAASGVLALRRRPDLVFVVVTAALLVAVVRVHVSVLPKRDTRRPDREFLTTLHEDLPPDALVVATGAGEIARAIFHVRVPVAGVWHPEDVAERVGDARLFYVVARRRIAPALDGLGWSVTIAGESRASRGEETIEDRLTLFRVERPPANRPADP